MIEFAGVALLDQNDDLQRMLEGLWSPEWVDYWRPSNPLAPLYHTPAPGYFKPECPNLGVLKWPSGASRWSTFFALVSDTQLRSIRSAVGDPPTAKKLIISDGSSGANALRKGRIETDMWMLPPRPVTQAARKFATAFPSQATKDLWLLPLVDERWWWHYEVIGGPSNEGTWSSVLSAWLTILSGAAGTIDTIPAEYGKVRGDKWHSTSNIWLNGAYMLDAAVEMLGARFTRDLAGACRVWRPANAKTSQQDAYDARYQDLIAGGIMSLQDMRLALPASAYIWFDFETTSRDITKTLASIAPADAGGSAGLSGRTVSLYSEQPDPPITGQSTDANVATQLTTDWYAWRFASRVDAVFRGLQDWPVGGAEWCVEWHSGAGGTQPTTRVYPLPWHDWSRWASAKYVSNVECVANKIVVTFNG